MYDSPWYTKSRAIFLVCAFLRVGAVDSIVGLCWNKKPGRCSQNLKLFLRINFKRIKTSSCCFSKTKLTRTSTNICDVILRQFEQQLENKTFNFEVLGFSAGFQKHNLLQGHLQITTDPLLH